MQLAGLTLPPLSIVLQLGSAISLGQMLTMGYWRKDGEAFVSTVKGRRLAAANKLVWKLLRIGEE